MLEVVETELLDVDGVADVEGLSTQTLEFALGGHHVGAEARELVARIGRLELDLDELKGAGLRKRRAKLLVLLRQVAGGSASAEETYLAAGRLGRVGSHGHGRWSG